MPRVCVVGSANVDFTVALPRLPAPGETVSGGTLLRNLGGKGANQAVSARRLGAEVRLLGGVGRDASGEEIRARLDAEGIDVRGLITVDAAATGTALIFVDADGHNQIGVAPGANHALEVAALAAHADALAWAQVVVCQLETALETLAWTLEEARRRGAATILNPAPVRDGLPDIWRLVDYLTPNEGEAGQLTGTDVRDLRSAAAAAQALRARGVGTAIVTLGAEGALAGTAQGEIHARALSVSVVDTTAAGDAFNGALAAVLGGGDTLGAALRFANAAAALACTRRGAQPSLPTRAEVDRLLEAGERGG
jgi:ribokinase